MDKYSKVPTSPFLDPSQFEWTKRLEENWQVMPKELDSILENKQAIPNFQDISKDLKALTQDSNWKTYFFMALVIKPKKTVPGAPQLPS